MSHNNHTRYSKMYGEENMTIDTFEPGTETEIETEVRSDSVDVNENAFIEPERIEVDGQTEIEVTILEPKVEPEVKVDPPTFGNVINCKKLNVRKFPDKGAMIVSTLPEGTMVMIDMKGSTTLFYKICTECGIEGYCMKNFIKVLP